MKPLLKIACTICLFPLILSCDKDIITASEDVTTRAYSFSGYTSIDIADNFTVLIRFSETEEKIDVEANDNLHGYIDVDQIGDVLKINLKDIHKIKGTETLNVFITTKHITDIKASGNSKLVIQDVLNAPEVTMDLTGNSGLRGTLVADRINLFSKGNSVIDLSGSTETLEATLSGNCELTDFDLTVEALKINLSGNSNAYLTVTRSIHMTARGNSVLTYQGDANIVHQELSSASKIIKI